MVLLSDLAARLGPELQPIFSGRVPRRDVTAVHVSELTDPGRFLQGGELILTTGIPLHTDRAQVDAYIAGLKRVGIAALALGLGESFAQIPRDLIDACGQADLPLFAVPPETAFLAVSRAFLSLSIEASREQSWASAFSLHRALMAATFDRSRRAELGVVDALAAHLGRWVVYVGDGLVAPSATPRPQRAIIEQVAGRLSRQGTDASLTSIALTVGGEHVSAFPIVGDSSVIGYLCVSGGSPIESTDRQSIYHAASALASAAGSTQGIGSLQEAVAQLLLSGHVAAAVDLAAEGRVRLLGPRVKLLVVRSARGGFDVSSALSCRRQGLLHVLVSADVSVAFGDGLTGATSPAISLESLPELAPRVLAAARTARTGVVVPVAAEREGSAAQWVTRLESHSDAFVPTAAAYLRSQGRWEQASRELGIHRNTLRQRIQAIRATTRIDLDDPDTAAAIWLELRARGDA